MAVIHDTTMSPGKLELLAAWLPAQPGPVVAADGPSATDLRVETASAGGTRCGQLTVRVNRILRPSGGADQPGLSAPWRLPDGTRVRGILATADYDPVPGPWPWSAGPAGAWPGG
jgi:hypothetical protein